MSNELKLFTNGEVTTKDGRGFTRLVGGFGKDKPMFLLWQASELLGQETREITQNFERNQDNFEKEVDYIDLKSLITENDKTETIDITDFFKSLGITHHKYGRAKQWLAFSFSGMLKMVKIATTKESWKIYDEFLEDYFKTKAENKNMKLSIEEEIKKLKEDKKSLLGEMFMESDEGRKIELFNKNEELNRRITKLEKSMSEKEMVMKLQPKLSIVDKFTNSDGYFDIGAFSKILNIKDMGRNKLFRWMKDQKILMKNNEPYQRYMDYFKVFPVTSKSGMIFNKTMIKPKGITYIFKKLIQDNKIIPKSIDEVIEELEAQPKAKMNI